MDNVIIMNKAVFIDRDGTINNNGDFVYKVDQFKLIENSDKAIKKLNKAKFKVIVITNQPVVARNLCTEDEVEKINNKMISLLKEKGARIDAVYYCPHHPEKHHKDGNPSYRIDCECRKPKTGMIMQAKEAFDIDLSSSFVVGDSMRDVKAGKDAGCKTILLLTGHAGKGTQFGVKPDFVCRDILEAAQLIVGEKK